MALTLTSSAFADGQQIPSRFTCDGADVSPALRWSNPPAGTKSFALIADDPDAPAGTWVHWVLFNVPAGARGLDEARPTTAKLPDGSLQGTNDFKRLGYGGPCPPKGPAHRYFFKLFAIDRQLDLPTGATKQQVLEAMAGHVLDQATLMGRYKR